MRSILVVAAHPDDEVLGCGGTLARLAESGATIHTAFLADGVSSRTNETDFAEALARRRAAARQAADFLGVATQSFADLPDNRLDTVPMLDLTKLVEGLIVEHHPDSVFTHHAGDLNVDHRRVHEAVATACRPQHGHGVRTLLCFEVPSSTEWAISDTSRVFAPTWFVNIANTLPRKLAALEAYASEVRSWPHPRSVRGVETLASWRGATIGTDAAEAFVLARHLA